ncbi:hypothetical protein ACHMW7_28205 [Aminobacter sp. UC22_36]|uniref:hypothetical protein n=1 Tax=Aminobacter sp. UC22_36 TaxID=3374549 RepID=UPI003756BF7A
MTPPAPKPQAITLPAEASTSEVADFARGIAVLERLARRVAELARAHENENSR